ncbi:Uu.00g028480.m01.CDS01 [Anthostomella pinea]|uniref:Uu.00g028480.m01.CDS01 n=1 Tax=Anthostomella pinea TaxID=933095 RepID=A0AAI8YCR7_9PEZI|nr:Uu.00g028480.m01.CDS01 [Anthostomella pinea]
MLSKSTTTYAIALVAASQVNAHTWVEQLFHIDSTGAFTGEPGYPFGFVPRNQNVVDDVHQNKILDTSTNPVVCKPRSSSNYAKYPPLEAAAGDYIAMTYEENGHVSQPNLTPRPYRGGNVFVYGSLKHEDSEGINDVLNAWTVDGKGGNGNGRLIATHYFDDGQCYQNNPDNAIVQSRMKAVNGPAELRCQSDLQLPEDLPSEGIYTIYWVWDWPLITSDTQNTTEIYTSCADITLGGAKVSSTKSQMKYAKPDNVAGAGISSQLNILVEATALGIGTSSPAAPPSPTAQPDQTTDAPDAPSPSESTSTKNHKGGVKTVTVTADAATVTQWTTVTLGAGDGTAQPSGHTTAASQSTQQTDAAPSAPTSLVPVSHVEGFLKARTTGQARRESSVE